MATNLIGQEPWELRGANEARLRSLETRMRYVPYQIVPFAAYAGNGSQTLSTFADYPGPVDVTFTKLVGAASDIIVTGTVGAFKETAPGIVTVAFSIGGNDHPIGDFFFNDLVSHRSITCTERITGVAAGSLTWRLRWKTDSSKATTDANDAVRLTFFEVPT